MFASMCDQFRSDHHVVEDCYRKTHEWNGEQYVLEIIDTAGTEQFTSMVELYVRNCQV